MTNLDQILSKKLQIFGENENGKNLNLFYISKEEVVQLLAQKSDGYKKVFERLEILCSLFHLDEQEKEIISIVLAPLLDSKYQKIYAFLQDDLSQKEASISLVSLLLYEDEKEKTDIYAYFHPQSPLMIYHIIEEDSVLKISESVQSFLFGYYYLDSKVADFSRLIHPDQNKTNNLDLDIEKKIDSIVKGVTEQKRFLIHLYGESSSDKEHIALEIASFMGYGVLKVDIPLLLEYTDILNGVIEVLFRESILSGTLLYFDNYDVFTKNPKFLLYQSMLMKKLDALSWLSFISSNEQIKPLIVSDGQLWYEFPVASRSMGKNAVYWQEGLKRIGFDLSSQKCKNLTHLFQFTNEQIEIVLQQLETQTFFGEKIDEAMLYQMCRKNITSSLKELAQPFSTTAVLEDIVLEKEQKELMRGISTHYKHQFQVFEEWGFKKHYQSQGIGVLFTGSPGTGKTMAASILANELGLDIYRIELSQVISKYIGETEKNLSRIFEEARKSGVILFFDEADAIFGKRTETKDSHDRYANIEVSYLLQKIEEYDGLVILASNFRQNIDEAFVRRMRFIINFPFPDKEMREQIWKRVFPENSPLEQEIDFALLSQNFALSGANIRNIALFSAFFAAEQQEQIQMKHIVQGLKIELTKIGKTFKSTDFASLLS